MTLVSAHRLDEKRFSMPFQHLSDDETRQLPVEMQPSTITKYIYKALPEHSRHDERAQPVKLRKKRIQE